ncbi:MAG: alcohol dehydrogenase [Zetaproteobacteria bacterium CG_4_9_14_3_um_filter_54_145]|nr:MAG: alcohol dehydrogenase [Zetaproteobacteria bacterium CG23_combo_of_CG06-09_8_20_14_all_54_7]PIX53547.1 MAG: alcohol dehydrogenase [Zetaproteobacteria bacterium CG_4_10_14_3_um_filter_54_28]PJA28357.1 MAG: alcohol dehydrogenase [Zetaproteobacteria bacterium CG_4_9_14_3_um_filter_54_145]
MRVIIMKNTGNPEVLSVGERERPTCGPDEVLVRIIAAGVNPVDTKLRSRGLFCGELPAILGCDGAGFVEAIGANVTRFEPGDAVYYCYGGLGQAAGNYAEYIAVPEAYVAQKPDSLDFIDAAAAPLVLITAWEALFDRARLQSGQHVYIAGGAGGVGHIAIQLAKLAGCSVATSVSSDEKADIVRELGADLIIRYHQQEVSEALLAWTNGLGVDVAFDTVGGTAFNQLVSATRVYGDIVTILQVPDDADWKTIRLRNIRVSQELMLTPMLMDLPDAAEHHGDILEQCAQFFDECKLSVFVSDTLPLEQAAEAHRRIEAGSMSGKLVLEVQDSGFDVDA